MEIQILSVIGFVLSVYAFIVEKKKEKNSKYKALCDINDKISCTKVFSSKYGKMAILPNSFYGMIFYLVIFLLAFFGNINYIFYLSVISVIGSSYLAYVLYFKVKNFCLVCHGIYIVNILILIFSWVRVY